MALAGLSGANIIEFMRKSQQNPVWWIETVLGDKLWGKQRDMICSIRDNERTTVKACHAPGKTHLAADAVLWFLNSFPDSIVLTTAPTFRQVEQLLWKRIAKIYKRANYALGGKLFKQCKLEIAEEWYALGLSPNEPDRMQGFHATWILIICDEASGVPDEIFEAIRGIMASGNVRFLMLGNPIRPAGLFYDSFNTKGRFYNQITISAFDTPNLSPIKQAYIDIGLEFANQPDVAKEKKLALLRSIPKPFKFEYLTSPHWVADMIDEFDEDAPIVQSKVFANFPSESPNQLIPLWRAERAVARYEDHVKWWDLMRAGEFSKMNKLFGKNEFVEVGVDVARYGDNESVFIPRLGPMAHPAIARVGNDTTANFHQVRHIRDDYMADYFRIDGIGPGAGLVDRCNEDGIEGIIDINVGRRAHGETKEAAQYAREHFANLRAQLFWQLRKRFFDDDIMIPNDTKLLGQLSSILYHANKGRIQIQSKDDMTTSPDRADGLALAFGDVYPEFIPPLVGRV